MIRWSLLAVLGIVMSAVVLLQRETTANLRGEIALLREENGEIAKLKGEGERLAAAQPTSAELERLRADRAALVQLRSEIDAMKIRADQSALEGAQRTTLVGTREDNPTPGAAKDILVNAVWLAFGTDGGLASDGSPLEFAVLRTRLAALGRDARVNVIFTLPPKGAPPAVAKATVESVLALAGELGLKMGISFDQQRAVPLSPSVPAP
jgi:hypothetical protein